MINHSKFNKPIFIGGFIALTLIAIATLSTSNKAVTITKEESTNDSQIKIGLSMDSLVVERWQTDRDIFVAKAKQLGANVLVQKANNDTQEQITQVKYLIDEGVDVLVIIPHDSYAFENIVYTAKKSGVKVIAYDRLIKNSSVDLYISFDNKKVGTLMGQALLTKVNKGNYLIINGGKEDYNTTLVNNAFKEVLKPSLDSGDIKIINEVWAEGWNETIAYNCIDDALNNGEKIDAIMCGNDRLAEAVIQALAERQLAGKIPVIGQDAALSGCQSIAEGTQLMTVYKPIKHLAETAAELAVALAKNDELNTNSTMYDGSKYVPFYVTEPIVVNKDNLVDIIVKDNFHSLEDIYRNVPKENWPKTN